MKRAFAFAAACAILALCLFGCASGDGAKADTNHLWAGDAHIDYPQNWKGSQNAETGGKVLGMDAAAMTTMDVAVDGYEFTVMVGESAARFSADDLEELFEEAGLETQRTDTLLYGISSTDEGHMPLYASIDESGNISAIAIASCPLDLPENLQSDVGVALGTVSVG